MRRVDGPRRQDHLAVGSHLAVAAALANDNANAALAIADQPARQRLGFDPQVGSGSRLGEEGAGGRASKAAVARHLRIANPLLLVAIEILGEGNANLLCRRDEAMRQGQRGTVVLDQDRPLLAALLGTGRIALNR